MISINYHKNFVQFLRNYFRYKLIGIENLKPLINSKKPFIIFGNHSINFVDPMLFIHEYYVILRSINKLKENIGL